MKIKEKDTHINKFFNQVADIAFLLDKKKINNLVVQIANIKKKKTEEYFFWALVVVQEMPLTLSMTLENFVAYKPMHQPIMFQN